MSQINRGLQTILFLSIIEERTLTQSHSKLGNVIVPSKQIILKTSINSINFVLIVIERKQTKLQLILVKYRKTGQN